MGIEQIRKRDGRVVPFEAQKIAAAIQGAMRELRRENPERADQLAEQVGALLEDAAAKASSAPGRIAGLPTVEQAQDLVERVLIEAGDTELAKAYILHRFRHASLRKAKTAFGVRDDLKLSLNAIRVLEKRYLRKDTQGRIIESPSEMFRRVADAIAAVDANYEGAIHARESAEQFYRMMSCLEFLPNSPTLMNAGTELGQLSACFVLPVADSMNGIFSALRCMAFIHQSGGGTGFSFSRLRPRGDVVRSTGGVASGPISFIEVFDKATEVIKQGGRRRGANMAILDVNHPDILEFILCKTRPGFLENFNISVAVDDRFMEAVIEGREHVFINPRSGVETGRKPARDVFDLICSAAWQCGDPGLVFIDEVNRHNPLIQVAAIEATNPCGEQPLLPNESCNLGSINLSRFLRAGGIDFGRLGLIVEQAVHFLDNVIDANRYPLPEIDHASRRSRKIGLGVMGFADALYTLGMPYDSEVALELAQEVAQFITARGREASRKLGETRGSFPLFDQSAWPAHGFDSLRNATVTTVAPTGTIGLIAGASSGIEPVFALRYWRTMAEGTTLFETHPEFERRALEHGLDAEALFEKNAQNGSIQSCADVSEDIRKVFVVARDISPEWHVRMQAAFQAHTDAGVSKTVNLAHTATVDNVRKAFLLAHELHCKGITVYREGSRDRDVLQAEAPGSALARLPHLAPDSCDPDAGAACRRCPG